MNLQAQQILDQVCEESAFRVEALAPLTAAGEFGEELQRAIEQNADKKRWGSVCRLIWVAQRFPSRRLVPVLSNLLDAREDDGCLEAIVDALAVMPDKRAVGALTHALSYRLPGDDLAFHFNRKVLAALSAVGNDEAVAAIKEALRSDEEPIRTVASQLLTRFHS